MDSVLLLHFEEGKRHTRGKTTLVCLQKHASKLNRICRKLDLTPIRDFRDGTSPAREAFAANVTDTVKIMVKSKLWFPVTDGLATLVPLLQWLEQNPTRFGLLSDDYRGVVEELRQCIAELESQPAETRRFNLGVVPSAMVS